MKKEKKMKNNEFGVINGMEKDGIWNAQRRNNVEERGERKYVAKSPHFTALSRSTMMILKF